MTHVIYPESAPNSGGMCHWKEYLKAVVASNFQGLSHQEWDVVMDLAAQDLGALKMLVHEACEGV